MDSAIVPNTRASRGLGEGLLELYVAKLNHTVVASVRDPNHGTTEAPTELPTAEGYALLIIKVDSTIQADAADGVKQLTANGIDHIDIIIINTSIAYAWPKASEVRVDNMKEHMSVCLCGYPTLSSHSSLVENDLKALSEAHPQHILRLVQTDMGYRGTRAFGAEQALIAVEQNINGVIKAIHNATREIHGEKLWLWEGRQIPF